MDTIIIDECTTAEPSLGSFDVILGATMNQLKQQVLFTIAPRCTLSPQECKMDHKDKKLYPFPSISMLLKPEGKKKEGDGSKTRYCEGTVTPKSCVISTQVQLKKKGFEPTFG